MEKHYLRGVTTNLMSEISQEGGGSWSMLTNSDGRGGEGGGGGLRKI